MAAEAAAPEAHLPARLLHHPAVEAEAVEEGESLVSCTLPYMATGSLNLLRGDLSLAVKLRCATHPGMLCQRKLLRVPPLFLQDALRAETRTRGLELLWSCAIPVDPRTRTCIYPPVNGPRPALAFRLSPFSRFVWREISEQKAIISRRQSGSE